MKINPAGPDRLNSMNNQKLVIPAVIIILAIVLLSFTVSCAKLEGNEVGVKETWWGGVESAPLTESGKTYILFPAFTQRIIPYKVSTRVFVMNDKQAKDGEVYEGRNYDSYLVQSKDQQDMRISLQVQWHIDPAKVVELHKTNGPRVEENLLRPEVMRVVKDEATKCTALEAYSGEGLVALQKSIQARLSDKTADLAKRGVMVDLFVIEHIGLDKDYTQQIVSRQVAVQRQLRAVEETKAAQADAERAKAEAQADYERTIVAAKRDKDAGILQAEQFSQQQIIKAKANAEQTRLDAEAAKDRVVLAAEGEQQSGSLKAQAIRAIGEAEGAATRAKVEAYNAPGANTMVRLEAVKNFPIAFQNIKGFLPSDAKFNVLASDYIKGVSALVGDSGDAK